MSICRKPPDEGEGGLYLPNQSLVRMVWPRNRKLMENHGRSTTLLESLACLQGYLATLRVYGRDTFFILCDNAGAYYSIKKGHRHCSLVWTILKAVVDVSV